MSTEIFEFTVKVKTAAGTNRNTARRLLKKLLQIGEADATEAQEEEGIGNNADADLASYSTITVTDPKITGFVVVEGADGDVISAVFKSTEAEAMNLAADMAVEQGDDNKKNYLDQLTEDMKASDDNGWTVYVLPLKP